MSGNIPKEADIDKYILVKNARVHNLKNVSINIPRDKLVVVTGLSGSGKSSLVFNTLYAEGQRKYVESLSSYARQFLGRLSKPDVDEIFGIPPAIAIEQRVNSRNARSTVGTSTEIYDYLKLLYARVGKTISPISNQEVKKDTVTDTMNFINSYPPKTKGFLLFNTIVGDEPIKTFLTGLQAKGFSRILIDNNIEKIDDLFDTIKKQPFIQVVVDRFIVNADDDDNVNRISDSIEIAYYEGKGECQVAIMAADAPLTIKSFSNKYELDGIQFEEPSLHLFSFNNPFGACPRCEGFGTTIGIDEDLVVPNKRLSLYEGAVQCWRGEKMILWQDEFIQQADKYKFPIHRPYKDLNEEELNLLWYGKGALKGINDFFKYVDEKKYQIQYRVLLSRYSGKTICPDCKGSRLKKEAIYVKVDGKSINDLVLMPTSSLFEFVKDIQLNESEALIAKRILDEVSSRLQILNDVGLGYLNLNRNSNTLSGGESQRIRLTSSLGSGLVGSLYVLDEPSIGLHSRDTERLIKVLLQLRDIGNTVVVVEHDEEIIRIADEVIDIGPFAGAFGGELVFQGNFKELKKSDSLTAKYLYNRMQIKVPTFRRKWNEFVKIQGAHENNLKYIDVKFPLHVLTVVTGVSGSGKSSLVNDVLHTAIKRAMGDGYGLRSPKFDGLEGDFARIESIEFVDQNPIGKSSRSNPVTYTKAYDDIRALFTRQKLAQYRGYKPSHFSFNIEGGRCDECEGEGKITVEMQFMADVELLCESCKGKRFKDEVLEITYREKSIFDILNFTVDEAISFFESDHSDSINRKITEKLQPLADVGLGYLRLGQASSTLSGGEAQRIKLALFLQKGISAKHSLFIFDEPTTGLHFHDINKLLIAFNSLIDRGHSIIVIEHNVEVIKSADWIIDLGPDGGDKGGNIVFEGIPEDLQHCKESHTAKFLIAKLAK